MKTDLYEGFQLDYGFQIFLTAYPEAQRFLDYDALRLKPFYNGAMVWHRGNFYRVADPFRHPIAGVASVFNPIGSIEDKARVGLLRLLLANKTDGDILADDETAALERLRVIGSFHLTLYEMCDVDIGIFICDDRSFFPTVFRRHLFR